MIPFSKPGASESYDVMGVLARQAVASGAVECALALGFEQMERGALAVMFADRPTPFEPFDQLTEELIG